MTNKESIKIFEEKKVRTVWDDEQEQLESKTGKPVVSAISRAK